MIAKRCHKPRPDRWGRVRAIWVVASIATLEAACSVLNRIDTCDSIPDQDRQVNALTSGDQYPVPGRSLARIGPDLYVASWVSEDDPTPGAPSELRATLLHADGTVRAPCGSNSGDLAISTATDEVVGRPAVAVGPEGAFPIFFAWRATPSAAKGGGPGTIRVRLMDQDLCPWNSGPQNTLILAASDDTDDGANPAITVRSDGLEAIVAWVSVPTSTTLSSRIRSRPVGIASDHAGRTEPNACDGQDAPCTHSTTVRATGTTITPFGSGYALAWAEQRADGRTGFDVRVEVLDKLGAIRSMGRGQRPFGNVGAVDLASVATAQQILVAEGAEPSDVGLSAQGDNDIYLERFGADGSSLGSPERINALDRGWQEVPAVTLLNHDAAFLSWTTVAGGSDVWGRVVDASGTPMFGGVSCDTSDFRLSSTRGQRIEASSLAGDDANVLATFASETTARGATDTLGLSVHVRSFDVPRVFPALR